MPGIGGGGAQQVKELKTLLFQLERGERVRTGEEQARSCRDFLEIARRWPEEPPEEEKSILQRLTPQVPKFTDAQQHDIVGAFRPLNALVRKMLIDKAIALNGWLGEAPEAEKDRGAHAQKLAEVLQGMDDALWFRCYKNCSDMSVKAQFLLAAASVTRAVHGDGAPLRSQVVLQPRAAVLVRRMAERLFQIQRHGNVLCLWHEGRLERYNRTLWRAARRAADRLRDDLQVRLVSALRRASATTQTASGKAKPQLQLELRPWPMVGCPLARAFLEFVAARGHELGNLGTPCLSECPPHSLWPQTLRRLLGRLEAFETLDSEPSDRGERLGIVRLRWEAVAALAFKAVRTKPKAAAQAATVAAAAGAAKDSSSPPPKAGAAGGAARRAGLARPPAKLLGGEAAMAEGRVGATKLTPRKLDWNNTAAIMRLLRRGLRSGDEEWRQGWMQFCKQRRLSADGSGGQASSNSAKDPTKDAVVEYVQRNHARLLKKEWARDLLYKEVRVGGAAAEGAGGVAGKGKESAATVAGAIRKRSAAAAAAAAPNSANGSRSRDESSSASDSSRSKRRRKKRRRERKLSSLMGYSDYFGRGQKDLITPEAMMMNQMMGMSMMMSSPLAMMGMGTPMLSHPMPMLSSSGSSLKQKKETRERERGAGPAVASSSTRGGAAPAEPKPPAKEAKQLDWSKRKEAMINADDL